MQLIYWALQGSLLYARKYKFGLSYVILLVNDILSYDYQPHKIKCYCSLPKRIIANFSKPYPSKLNINSLSRRKVSIVNMQR